VGLRLSAAGSYGHRRPLFGPIRSETARPGPAAQRKDRPEGHVWAADGANQQLYPCLEEACWSARASLNDIPKEWESFWSFWCAQVQPAVRKALGRDDIWGIGRHMSVLADDTTDQLFQFIRPVVSVYPCLRCGPCDPGWQARHRRPEDQAAAGQGDRCLRSDLSQTAAPRPMR
jgi:hypothetical protein